MEEWVRVSDRVPTREEVEENFGWFLVYLGEWDRIEKDRYDGCEEERTYEHGWKYFWGRYITHWRRLPNRPEILDDFQ